MRTNAAVAGEVLLACVIEGEPEDDQDSSLGVEDQLGIEYDGEAYPTAPWKSPFYAFLQINSDAALNYLHQLVDFSTDRWVHAARTNSDSDPAMLSLSLPNDTIREYAGNYRVFSWSHDNSLSVGQLHSALAGLEQWLCDLIDAGVDIAPQIETLLRVTNFSSCAGCACECGENIVTSSSKARCSRCWAWRNCMDGIPTASEGK